MDVGIGLLVGLVVALIAFCILLVRRENRNASRLRNRHPDGSAGAMGGAGATDSGGGCGDGGGGGGGE